ncbi:MAG: NAD-dependent dehydratase [Rhodospirillaceae bacterium]|nr:NAD-dependent dehydratase [Rhodospirillaceae bacterium]
MTQRVLVFGGNGFVGSNIISSLSENEYEPVSISRSQIDFSDPAQCSAITKLLRDDDIVVLAAAKAPAKDLDMLIDNISLMNNLVEGIRKKSLKYILNISSDAVYGDPDGKIDETSEMSPLNPHGIMHCMREKMLEQRIDVPIGHLRSTLIYGPGDPHNGYGPNSFIRLAMEEKDITLFGNGEELRDHIHVSDVARIAVGMIDNKIDEPINAVTGAVVSFREIAEAVVEEVPGVVKIKSRHRSGPMPHNGYRAFNNSKLLGLLEDVKFTDLREYIRRLVRENA